MGNKRIPINQTPIGDVLSVSPFEQKQAALVEIDGQWVAVVFEQSKLYSTRASAGAWLTRQMPKLRGRK